MELDDFDFSDEKFIPQNEITRAYGKVFKNIREIADHGLKHADCADSKGVIHDINKLANKVYMLIQLTTIDTKIIGANGAVYNPFGEEVKDDGNNTKYMSQDELLMKINEIIDATTKISYKDCLNEIEKKKIENGEESSENDKYDDIDW